MSEKDEELREWLLSRGIRNRKVMERVQAIREKRAERLANMTPEEKEAYLASMEEALKANQAIEESLKGRASRLAFGRRGRW